MAKSKLNKCLNWIILVCIVINLYIAIIGILFKRKVELPIGIPTQSQVVVAYNILNEDYKPLDKTKEELREIITKDLHLRWYFYKEKSMEDYAGKTYAVIRLILIDTNVSGYEFAQVFTHEVIHLKKMVSNESWVSFETFKYLYESEELHNVGVWYGQRQLQGCYYGEYNIADLIVNYLTNN